METGGQSREEGTMSGTRRDYRSYLLRLYRVRKGGETSWRASLHSPEGGKPLHFRGLSEMVGFLEQEGELEEDSGEQGRAGEVADNEGEEQA
jgi:hypothetical protein